MQILFYGLAIMIMLGILSMIIIVHETGHYLVARMFGFQTPVFGFGLPFAGPYWVIGRRWGTEFRFHALLLGGYVAIPELGDESQLQEDLDVELKPFRKFPIWQRICVASAGVAFNIISAYFIMVAMFMTLGQPVQPTVVHSLIASNPIAAQAGIKAGDQLYSINGQKVFNPDDAVHILTSHKATEVKLEIVRQGQSVTIPVTTNRQGKVGMALVSRGHPHWEKVDGGFFHLCWLAAARLWSLTANMLEAMGQLVTGIFGGGGGEKGPSLGLQDLHGVFAVIKIGADIAQQDWTQLFLFTIMISMDIAIINIMPFPVLDGWHVFCFLIESVRGKPLPEKPNAEILKWGVVTLLALMAIVTINDISAMMQGKLNFKMDKDERGKGLPNSRKSEDLPDSSAGDTRGGQTGSTAGNNAAVPEESTAGAGDNPENAHKGGSPEAAPAGTHASGDKPVAVP